MQVFDSVRHESSHRDAAGSTRGRVPIPASLQSPRTRLDGGQELAALTWEYQGAKPLTDLGGTGRAALATVAGQAGCRVEARGHAYCKTFCLGFKLEKHSFPGSFPAGCVMREPPSVPTPDPLPGKDPLPLNHPRVWAQAPGGTQGD